MQVNEWRKKQQQQHWHTDWICDVMWWLMSSEILFYWWPAQVCSDICMKREEFRSTSRCHFLGISKKKKTHCSVHSINTYSDALSQWTISVSLNNNGSTLAALIHRNLLRIHFFCRQFHLRSTYLDKLKPFLTSVF